ncbi:MAG: DUF4038 domain-containing protein [Sphingobacteriaceae bacterium]|nr:DUF4038 domain-containing protein [Sphingobacteriaceae bacterium]
MKTSRLIVVQLMVLCCIYTSCSYGQPLNKIAGGLNFPLKVSDDKHYLTLQDGTPFYYVADTQWPLFWYYSMEEAKRIIDDRVNKGFTGLQLSLASWRNQRNKNGHSPFIDPVQLTPDTAYFNHADMVLDYMASKGLVAYLPVLWFNQYPKASSEANFTFGKWLGTRWKDRANIIWVVGGDTPFRPDQLPIFTSLASGIKSSGANQLFTQHPHGGDIPSSGISSSAGFHNEMWLDFNSIQAHTDSSLSLQNKMYADYNRKPTKPVLYAEGWYYWLDGQPLFNIHKGSYDIRKAHYISRLAGSFGEGYGAYPFWWGTKGWEEALGNQSAATHIATYMKRLFEPREWHKLRPDFSRDLIINRALNLRGLDEIAVATSPSRDLAIIYFPRRTEIQINKKWFSGKIYPKWYDPTIGTYTKAKALKSSGNTKFSPPGKNNNGEDDFVLILETKPR